MGCCIFVETPDHIIETVMKKFPAERIESSAETPSGTIPSRVCGRVLPAEDAVYISPLSGRPCISYGLVVQEWYTEDKDSSWWRTLLLERMPSRPFFLQDGDNSVFIAEGSTFRVCNGDALNPNRYLLVNPLVWSTEFAVYQQPRGADGFGKAFTSIVIDYDASGPGVPPDGQDLPHLLRVGNMFLSFHG
jgi:hypothetical protein